MTKDDQLATKTIWLAIFILTAVIVAAATAALFIAAHAGAPSTATAAGAAFLGTVTFCFTVWKFLK